MCTRDTARTMEIVTMYSLVHEEYSQEYAIAAPQMVRWPQHLKELHQTVMDYANMQLVEIEDHMHLPHGEEKNAIIREHMIVAIRATTIAINFIKNTYRQFQERELAATLRRLRRLRLE